MNAESKSAPVESGENATNGRSARRRRNMLLGICLFFLLCGFGWGGYWLLFMTGKQNTDDAYVAGNQIRISARVTGDVTDIHADNNQLVMAGQVLVSLDATDAKVALDRARAELGDAVRRTGSLMAEASRLEVMVALRESELRKAEGDLARRKKQRTALSISEEELQHAKDDHNTATVALREAREGWRVNNMLLRNTPLEAQPQVLLAANRVREAHLALERCQILSPVTGHVARRAVQLGMHVTAGMALMAVVPLEQVWVDANFKEVQLSRMRIGQRAEVRADLYGRAVTFEGKVSGFSAGTGSSFPFCRRKMPPETG